jgi:DNA-binding IclR family transcriptional regulator
VTFNSLPPKPEHLASVQRAFAREKEVSLATLLDMTGLSKTQAMCALNELMSQGIVEKEKGRYVFRWIGSFAA